jgi:aldose 1-epimerase
MRGWAITMLAAAALSAPAAAAGVEASGYGKLEDGRAVRQYTLRNANGMVVRFIGYGGIITDIDVPDRQGRKANVALGFGSLAEYEARNRDYGFGAVIGRYAGRIAGARFAIDGREYRLQANDGPNALHGGTPGFAERIWKVTPLPSNEGVGARLTYTSPDGEQGFPGALAVTMTYRLLSDNSLRIDYAATSDAPTVLNLTNHSYFNLAGAGSGTVLDHKLQIFSNRYLLTDDRGIPLRDSAEVAKTPFDFTKAKALRECIAAAHPQMVGRRGYNHSWILGNDGKLVRAALLADPGSGRTLEVLTTEPSIHAYTANWFSGKDKGAQGSIYAMHDSIALETQHYPDSPNRPDFPSTLLRPGETYRSTTIYRFGVQGGETTTTAVSRRGSIHAR